MIWLLKDDKTENAHIIKMSRCSHFTILLLHETLEGKQFCWNVISETILSSIYCLFCANSWSKQKVERWVKHSLCLRTTFFWAKTQNDTILNVVYMNDVPQRFLQWLAQKPTPRTLKIEIMRKIEKNKSTRIWIRLWEKSWMTTNNQRKTISYSSEW